MFNGYKVYYGILNSHEIFNLCGESRFGEETDTLEYKKFLFNTMIENRNKLDNFYNNLEKSILEKGIINPIMTIYGWYNPKFANRVPKNVLLCDRNGGSRLYIAQKYNMDIPCIISDFDNKFSYLKELYTIEDIKNCFKKPPKKILFNHTGIYLENLPQFF